MSKLTVNAVEDALQGIQRRYGSNGRLVVGSRSEGGVTMETVVSVLCEKLGVTERVALKPPAPSYNPDAAEIATDPTADPAEKRPDPRGETPSSPVPPVEKGPKIRKRFGRKK